MAPGILVKALLRGGFSLTVYASTQVIMDLQPLIANFTGEGPYHGFTHTYVGATMLALPAALTGKYLAELALRMLPRGRRGRVTISWRVALLSAFIGSYSHIALDSLVHSDIHPLFPLSGENPMGGFLSVSEVQESSLYVGLLGLVLYFAVSYLLAKRAKHIKATG
jgi:hypothetical protein